MKMAINNMATIIIKRNSEYNNRLRDYHIYIDNKKVGSVANGQVIKIEAAAGKHKIWAKIDWCTSPELELILDNAAQKEVTVGGFKYGNWIMPAAGGIIGIHFLLKVFFDIQFGIYLVIPAFILLTYYLTVGRRKYLTILEV